MLWLETHMEILTSDLLFKVIIMALNQEKNIYNNLSKRVETSINNTFIQSVEGKKEKYCWNSHVGSNYDAFLRR